MFANILFWIIFVLLIIVGVPGAVYLWLRGVRAEADLGKAEADMIAGVSKRDYRIRTIKISAVILIFLVLVTFYIIAIR
jgi:hypothetical protein